METVGVGVVFITGLLMDKNLSQHSKEHFEEYHICRTLGLALVTAVFDLFWRKKKTGEVTVSQ